MEQTECIQLGSESNLAREVKSGGVNVLCRFRIFESEFAKVIKKRYGWKKIYFLVIQWENSKTVIIKVRMIINAL